MIIFKIYSLFFLLLLVFTLCIWGNTIYCYLFRRDDLKAFKKVTNLSDEEFEVIHEHFDRTGFSVKSYPNMLIEIDYNTGKSYIFGINPGDKLIASSFCKRASKKLFKKLLKKITHESSYTHS